VGHCAVKREGGGLLVSVGLRLIPAGIAALVAGFASGLALLPGGSSAVDSANAELPADASRLSVFGTIHPKRFDVTWDALGLQSSQGPNMRSGMQLASADTGMRLASVDTNVAVTSVVETDRPSDSLLSLRLASFDERFLSEDGLLFDQRFALDQRQESFD